LHEDFRRPFGRQISIEGNDETVWHDGPLTAAVRGGRDFVIWTKWVEARQKIRVVIIPPLTDDPTAVCPIPKNAAPTVLSDAPPEFYATSFSIIPASNRSLKDLKTIHAALKDSWRLNSITRNRQRREMIAKEGKNRTGARRKIGQESVKRCANLRGTRTFEK
jgi:hypothetical protein